MVAITGPDILQVGVVIVDDDEDARRLVRRQLEERGFVVLGEAGDGLEAIRVAKEHQPAFVVLDYQMPQITGEAAAGAIREVAPQSKIITLSAYLVSKPDWADAFLDKSHMEELPELLTGLLA